MLQDLHVDNRLWTRRSEASTGASERSAGKDPTAARGLPLDSTVASPRQAEPGKGLVQPESSECKGSSGGEG